MSCWDTILAYGLRSIGIGERLLPRGEVTLCEQFTLIGSGMLWNIYFGVVTVVAGFILATVVALARLNPNPLLRKPAEWFIFVFRGSPLLIQFFFGYFLFLSLKGVSPTFNSFTSAAFGAAVVLFLNTAAYSAAIFHGALQSIPRGDIEAADAYGLSGWTRFRRIIWPTMLRLAWPAYTNEAIVLFHSTTLVFVSSFPVIGRNGDALYYAIYFADQTFNPFIPYPILALYFILLTLIITAIFARYERHLNRHLPVRGRPRRLRGLNIAQVLR